MAYQFHQFESSDDSFANEEHKTTTTTQPGRRRIVAYALCGVLLLLLSVQLMVTGIKFSQLNKEINDVRLQLERNNPGGRTSASTADEGDTIMEEVFLERLEPVRGPCKEGWWSFQRKCYLLSTSTLSWSKAEQQCVTLGGHLLVLDNFQELDYISRIGEIRYHYWIGLVEREREGHWSWVDGTNFTSTTAYWDEDQPDDWALRENGEDCGQLHPSVRRKRKRWNDADCSMSYRYICESKA